MLTNEEKIAIVNQHLRNIEVNVYNIELSLIEANAKSTVDQAAVDALEDQITDLAAQKTALQAELTTLQA